MLLEKEIQTADTINRQAAIDVVSKACQEWRGIFGRCEDGLLALPSAQPEQRWIPVRERLPEEDKGVLISYRYKKVEGDVSYCDMGITSYGQAYFGGRKCSVKEWRAPFEYFHSNYEVVAWMPLPEAYKEDTNDN